MTKNASFIKALPAAVFTIAMLSLSSASAVQAKEICKQPIGEYGMYYFKQAKAKSSAVGRWEKKVAIKHGIGLSFWKNAKIRSNVCKKQANNTYRCFAIGTPCQTKTSCKPAVKKHGMYYFNKQKAKSSAKGRWEKQAAIQHGVNYSFWNSAKKKNFNCKKQANNTWRCLAIARPCN